MSAPPEDVLLLHGFTHTGRSWDRVRAALGRGYRALTPDLPGHGACSDTVTLGSTLDRLTALAPQRPFVLGGYSQGGRIALHAALDPRLARRVTRLVLIGASPGIEDPAERARRQAADEQLAEEIAGSSIEEFARRWARTPILAGLPPAVAQKVHEDRLRSAPEGLARALRGLGTGALPSLWPRLPELSIPVALVSGERDEKFVRIAREMAELIPDARVEVVPGAGHAVHLEAPEQVARLLSSA